jgi:hypothetical protein
MIDEKKLKKIDEFTAKDFRPFLFVSMIDEYGKKFWVDYLDYVNKHYKSTDERVRRYFITHVFYDLEKRLKNNRSKYNRKRFLLRHNH